MKISKAFEPSRKLPKSSSAGYAGYDNVRENIDPHIKTKAINSKEIYSQKINGEYLKFDYIFDSNDYTVLDVNNRYLISSNNTDIVARFGESFNPTAFFIHSELFSYNSSIIKINNSLQIDGAGAGTISIGIGSSPNDSDGIYISSSGFSGYALNTDGGIYANNLTTSYYISAYNAYISDGTYSANFCESYGGYISDGTNEIYFCDGTNALTINGSVGYTGDLNDSTSTKIADVVGGIITAVYY